MAPAMLRQVVLPFHDGLILGRGVKFLHRVCLLRRFGNLARGQRPGTPKVSSQHKSANGYHSQQRRHRGDPAKAPGGLMLLLIPSGGRRLHGKPFPDGIPHSGFLVRGGGYGIHRVSDQIVFHTLTPPRMVCSCFLARDRRLRTVLSGHFR